MGFFDNNETDNEKRKEAMRKYGLGITNNADSFLKEYLEDSLKEGIANGKQYIDNNVATMDGKATTVCPPEFESYNGAYMAWLIGAKDLSVEEAAKAANPRNEEAQAYVNEFITFVMTHSLVMDADGKLCTFDGKDKLLSAENANDFREIFGKAAKKFEEYKFPEIDYSDPNAVSDIAEDLTLVASLGKEIVNQTKKIKGVPYKISEENKKYAEKFADEIARKNVSNPETIFDNAYGEDNHKNIVNKLEDTNDKLNDVMREIDRCYGRQMLSDYRTPEQLVVERNMLNDIGGKTFAAASNKVKDNPTRANDYARVLTYEYGISGNRMNDKLKGSADPKLDEAVKDCISLGDGTIRSKIKTYSKKLDKSGYRKQYIKKQSRDNIDLDFKLMCELKGGAVCNAITKLLAEDKTLEKDTRFMLEKLSSSLNSMSKATEDAQNKKDLTLFNGGEVIPNTYSPLVGLNYRGEAQDTEAINFTSTFTESLDEAKQVCDTMALQNQDTPYPDEVKKILDQANSIINADAHFIDAIGDLNQAFTSLPQAKKAYGITYPEYKRDKTKLQDIISAKGNKLTIDDLEKADKEVALSNKKDTALSFKIDNKINVKKFIEKNQKAIREKGDMTFEQFADILAARASINVKRNSVNDLNRDESMLRIANWANDIQKNFLIKQFFADAKNDPKKWADLVNTATKGHGGMLEDKIKEYSNLVPLRKLSGDAVTERFVSTPKERIEAWQAAYKAGKVRKSMAASEILIMRNVAEAKAGSKKSLDKPITTEMLKTANQQSKILKDDTNFTDIIGNMESVKFDTMINEGHGGKLCEYIRFSGDSYKYTDSQGIKNILEQNTIVGKFKDINKELKACEKATNELYQQVIDKKISKPNFDIQVNEYLPRLVAEAVVASTMINKAMEDTARKGLRTDLDQGGFNKQVDKLMATEEFKTNYKTMMKQKNIPKEFNAKNIVEKYNSAAAENKAAAEKAKERQQFQKELGEKLGAKLPG